MTSSDDVHDPEAYDPEEQRICALVSGLTPREVLALEIGVEDRLWALLTLGLVDDPALLRVFACDCAERVLPIFEDTYKGERGPRQVIEVARRFARGCASRSELDAAERFAARDRDWLKGPGYIAACQTAVDDAEDAAFFAAHFAAHDAAWFAAAFDAQNADSLADWARFNIVWREERAWQLQRLREHLSGEARDAMKTP